MSHLRDLSVLFIHEGLNLWWRYNEQLKGFCPFFLRKNLDQEFVRIFIKSQAFEMLPHVIILEIFNVMMFS